MSICMSKLSIGFSIVESESACYHATFLPPHQTIGSEENQGLADYGVIRYYGWKKVTIFQLDVDSFENVRFSSITSISPHKSCAYSCK